MFSPKSVCCGRKLLTVTLFQIDFLISDFLVFFCPKSSLNHPWLLCRCGFFVNPFIEIILFACHVVAYFESVKDELASFRRTEKDHRSRSEDDLFPFFTQPTGKLRTIKGESLSVVCLHELQGSHP